ncbi:MAG: transcriptional regulator [Candidatus Accumulibacter phosphatis]|jgi:predicted transcriptional regulator|uniref:Transcriptional regulator n=1 Tax=Candidatus Accumulibacter phosphatis TaxID=327160 RepID=A0A6A7RQB4_9PROT|nr:transcriptional regulator [Candidatus Accumulibacter phosphatis]
MTRCVVGIRRGDDAQVASGGQYAPTIWFPSMATMAAVLSEDNRALLCIIRDKKPKTLTELAVLSGRQVPNLSRTLRMMEGYGLVELKRNVREIEPIARATDFLVVLDSPPGTRQ